jgi:hypothetical protein
MFNKPDLGPTKLSLCNSSTLVQFDVIPKSDLDIEQIILSVKSYVVHFPE